MILRRLITTTTLILVVFGSVRAQDPDRIPIPEGLFYYQPAATVYGAEAAWVNPARLAHYKVASFQLMADYLDGSFGRSWGYVIGRNQLTVAYRYLDRPDEGVYREWVWGGGFALPGGSEFGASYRYFSAGPGIYNNRHFWNIGLSGSAGPAIRWGAVFSNLNHGRVNGERTDTEMRFSVAYRPFGPTVTGAVDMFLSTGTRLSQADYRYHLEVRPTPGLFLYGSIDSDRNYTFGFRTNLLQYFNGSRSRFSRDNDGRGTTIFVGATAMRQPSLINPPPRRFAMNMTGGSGENPVQPVFGRSAAPFADRLMAIYRAAKDPSVESMTIELNRLRLGFGQAQELRAAIDYFRSRDKSVVAYVRAPNNISYYVASGCDRILIPPVAQVNLVGLRAELTFYAGTLDKLGVEIELMRVGEYKSATEAWTRESSSEAYREQINRQLDDLYEQFVVDIAAGRNLAADSVRAIIDRGPLTSVEAKALGLVDGLLYRDQFTREYLEGVPRVSFSAYRGDTLLHDDWRPRPKIAVVVAEGDVAGRSQGTPFMPRADVTPEAMAQAFDLASSDPAIKGVVFRINSPGGEALAGDEIHRTVTRAAEKKPVAVSMSTIATSAGYYFATPAQRIFASPATITGSIGIYGGKADLSGLYDKIELNKELYTRGRHAGMLTYMRPFSDEERAKYYSQLEAFYHHFVGLVAGSQNLSPDSVEAIARGRVWTGREARANGLVDELGGLREAADYVAAEAGIDDYDLVLLPERRPLFVLPRLPLIGSLAGLVGLSGSESDGETLEQSVLGDNAVMMARLPFDLQIE